MNNIEDRVRTYTLTEANRADLIAWLRSGHVQRAVNALENLVPAASAPTLEDMIREIVGQET